MGPRHNHSVQFWFQYFCDFRSTGGQNLLFPIDFAGYHYNNAAATAQPVMVCRPMWHTIVAAIVFTWGAQVADTINVVVAVALSTVYRRSSHSHKAAVKTKTR